MPISSARPAAGPGKPYAQAPDFLDWSRQNRAFEGMAAVTGGGFTYAGPEGPEFVIGAQATANVFRAPGVTPSLGRDFPGEIRRASPRR